VAEISWRHLLGGAALVGGAVIAGCLILAHSIGSATKQLDRAAIQLEAVSAAVADANEALGNLQAAPTAAARRGPDPNKRYTVNTAGSPALGPEGAAVTVVEFSDFQCPFCSRGYQTIENQVLKEYGDKVRFIYKDYPLPFHPWAEPAAIAAACVLEQKDTAAYWKLYSYYFENQKDLNAQNLKDKSLEVLKGTKVDPAKFTECLDGKKTQDIVKAEMAEGSSVGVTGTPAFIINGRLISGAQPFEQFKSVIDDELARADKK